MVEPPLYCNSCWTKVQNKAFKTSCDHCFCESCADQLFGDRRRRCGVCNIDVAGVLEFQIVGAPILDEQLTDVRSTLQAVACANGACSLDPWISNLHRFERVQLSLWGSRQSQASMDAVRDAEERERALSERELQSRQLVASLEHECDQLRKERDSAQRGVQDLQTALDERSRQADNWRAMYEALKSGGRMSIPASSSSSSSSGIGGASRALTSSNPVSSSSLSSSSALLMRGGDQNHPYNNNNNDPPMNGAQMNRFGSSNSYSSNPVMVNRLPTASFSGGGNGEINNSNSSNNSRFRSNSNISMDSSGSGTDFRSFPGRSSSMPRPPTRDLHSLMNRAVAPRTSSSFHQGVGGRSLGPPPQISEPVRSTFFAPAALRAASPSMNNNSMQVTRNGHPGGGGGVLY